jgi:hypothetical protein
MLMIVLAFAVGRIVSIVFVFSPGVGGCSQAVNWASPKAERCMMQQHRLGQNWMVRIGLIGKLRGKPTTHAALGPKWVNGFCKIKSVSKPLSL